VTDTRTFTVAEDDDGIRLDRWFKRHMPEVSFNMVSRWARTGLLRVDGKKATPGDRIEMGQKIRMPPAAEQAARPSRAQPTREPLGEDEIAFIRDMVIYEDPQAFVLNKPPGLATQGGTKTTQHLDRLLDGIGDERGRPKLVHRLDKDTSGALLVARTARAAGHFAKSFSGRTARKVYWALVVGVPDRDEGEIDAPLAKQPGTGGEKMHVSEEAGLPARTRWRLVERAGNRTAWVELQPLTGRTHQLRVHMAAIGHPIVGDGKYGGKGAFLTGAISRKLHLHSRRLRIDHPDGGALDISAPVPDHFAAILDALGFDLLLGDVGIDAGEKAAPPKSALKAQAKAHAKQFRKARRGERRGRTADSKPTDHVGKPKPKTKAGRPAAKKPAARKPGIGKGPARPTKR
jgi:23S rRNA pseudouridine955/2504/2580 synthase